MTFSERLAEATSNGKTVTAYKSIDKYASIYTYEITVANNGIAFEVIPAAKTTWKKKYNEAVAQWIR